MQGTKQKWNWLYLWVIFLASRQVEKQIVISKFLPVSHDSVGCLSWFHTGPADADDAQHFSSFVSSCSA